MADRTGIEWTDATWNPVRGCTRVSAGCQHCYAERVAARFSGAGQPYEGLIHPSTGGWNGKVRLVPEALQVPWRWSRPRRIFVNSMSDLFHPAVPFEFIAAVFWVMAHTSRHTYQVLTKRPERALEFFRWVEAESGMWDDERISDVALDNPAIEALSWTPATGSRGGYDNCGPAWPYANVWLGVSVEDQATADERIPLLLQCPAAVRWISAEPLLGRVDLCEHLGMWWNSTMQCFESTGQQINRGSDGRPRIDWVVAGGESGPDARPMHPDWARSLRDQCAAAGVPFLFKQWGSFTMSTVRPGGLVEPPFPLHYDLRKAHIALGGTTKFLHPVGHLRASQGFQAGNVIAFPATKSDAGRLLDGVLHDAYPETRQ